MSKSLFRYLSFLLVLLATVSIFGSVSALTPKAEKGVITIQDPRVVRQQPERVSPYVDIRQAPQDITYWKNILPRQMYRYEDLYIVLPTLGVVAPIVQVPEGSDDYETMTSGRQIDINKYLHDGVMYYPGTSDIGEVGNPVIFGHSNFFVKGPGNFKAIFADIMNLDVGYEDEIWIYQRIGDEYKLYRYEIVRSYETVPEDVDILYPTGGKELTVFACTNGLEGRWILRGKLIEGAERELDIGIRNNVRGLVEKISSSQGEEKQRLQGIYEQAIRSVAVRLDSTIIPSKRTQLRETLRWMVSLK